MSNFSLEELSLIEWAKEQEKILKFFDIIDAHITENDIQNYWNRIRNVIAFEDIERDDTINDKIKNAEIIEMFPQKEGKYLKTPKII